MYKRRWPQTGNKPPLLRGVMETCLQLGCFWNKHVGLNPKVTTGAEADSSPKVSLCNQSLLCKAGRMRSEWRLMGNICYDAESSLKDEHDSFLFSNQIEGSSSLTHSYFVMQPFFHQWRSRLSADNNSSISGAIDFPYFLWLILFTW